jgi:DNA polymerase II small subunit/DNA polymerase delta subunit B
MKIRITESQFKKIKLIKESEDQLAKFKEFCTSKAHEIDDIYSKILFETVDDILKFTLNFKEINKRVYKIENEVYQAEKNMLAMYNKGMIQGDDTEMIIGDIAEFVNDKTTSLTLILNKLEELQDYEEEHRLTTQFKNVRPHEI